MDLVMKNANWGCTVATLNIWNHTYHWEKRLPLISQLLDVVDADIIALQEVSEFNGINQADEICKSLDKRYHGIFVPSQEYKSGWSGNAFLSRLPIIDAKSIKLSQDPQDPDDGFSRNIMGIRVNLNQNQESISVFNTHLSLSKNARKRTIIEVLTFIKNFSGGNMSLLMGDFNCSPGEESINFITNNDDKQFQDIWATSHRSNNEDVTWPTDVKLVHRAWEERHNTPIPWPIIPARMDFIFVSSGKGLDFQITRCDKMVIEASDTFSSDHFAVIGSFMIRKTETYAI